MEQNKKKDHEKTNKEKETTEQISEKIPESKIEIEEPIQKIDKVQELTEQLQRAQADFENYKKWVNKQTNEQIQFAGEKILKKLIDFYDDFERVNNASKTQTQEEINESMSILNTKLKKLLEEENVKPMNCIGQKFDPYLHEAFAQENGKEDNIVLEELQKGYFLNSGVLRHAKVKVSKKQ